MRVRYRNLRAKDVTENLQRILLYKSEIKEHKHRIQNKTKQVILDNGISNQVHAVKLSTDNY